MAIRRTNNGKQIDMDALMAASKSTPAVGNMKVNAKGDVLGKSGVVVKKNEERVREYYQDNPRSSTSKASLKGETPSKLTPDTEPAPIAEPATAKTAKAEKKSKKTVEAPAVDEFDTDMPEPLGYKEVELPNGDIQMVPYYNESEK